MALSNPIRAQDIIDEFETRVVDKANNLIVWASDAVPVANLTTGPYGVVSSSDFETSKAGRANTVQASDFDNPIDADQIYNVLLEETKQYLFIRAVHLTLTVTVSDETNEGNQGPPADPVSYNKDKGPIGDPGVVFDDTQIASIPPGARTLPSVSRNGVTADQEISSSDLENLFDAFYSALHTAGSDILEAALTSCHANCHSSCHSSRGRR